ncbi:MAG: hypothetical protein AB1696_29120 [Planctomycetota bacterium]
MKRVVTLVALSVALVLSASMIAEAQSKKKGKEPELAICKRGKLIFEDDFSEKDILWKFDEKECDYRIIKEALATKSKCGGSKTTLMREITPMLDVIIEIKAFLPTNAHIWITPLNSRQTGGNALPWVSGILAPKAKSFYIQSWSHEEGVKKLALGALSYTKPRWVLTVFEAFQGNYALTVDGKTARWEQVPYEKIEWKFIHVQPEKPDSNDLLAVDDVKVYEALPKDEGEEKDEKGKRKK